jgi:FkbM family methyltransferase
MRDLLENSHILLVNNKIFIDPNKKHVKIDVGLSYGAPISQTWLSQEKDLVVFGFEANPEAVECIRSPLNKKKEEGHGDVLENKYLDKDFFLISTALGAEKEENKVFYIATKDEGCSSFYKPSGVLFDTEKTIHVNVFTLSDFFQYFPWEQFPYIEYLKIDAQGADLDILRGAGDYLKKIVFITAESAVGNLYMDVKDNDVQKVDEFMREKGFLRVYHSNTSDPTYLNYRFRDIASSIFIYQQG